MGFSDAIAKKYRVVTTTLGGGTEQTIPLGVWKEGDGLEGHKGHVYDFGRGFAGVWIKTRFVESAIASLQARFPAIVPMQVGDGEGTFRIPMDDLDRLLPVLKAKKRRVASPAQLEAIRKARLALPVA